ncbi:uncharacterized protein PFL1_03423 [Pseudozyma flocculosa PF-1]|uniref:Protein kinase domain-containing protein n=1 Tax=Pseudozyma flocculosa PF-1 TaxID=1277687 RepID=A0A061HAS8_9BASI|nr:uncharacterized protein PFL1_03423 [Pseudozyma flocculosa PF-1]EPQ29135.1 hypothetical protein PFL1_03423 [Pseudozyma flocculosa PF-1]
MSVSSIHFVLFAYQTDSGEIFVSCEDKSTNGLVWNGSRIRNTSVLLSDGDQIQVPGSQTFVFTQMTGYSRESNTRKRVRTATAARGSGTGGELTTDPSFHPSPIESRDGTFSALIAADKICIVNSGSFGKVYLAYDEVARRQVACKVQSKTAGNKDKTGMDLKWEIEPNINDLYDVFDDGQSMHLFLQLVVGGDLFEYIVRQRHLPDDVAKWLSPTCIRTASLIEPENILLVRGGTVMPHVLLGDFGLAYDAAARDAGQDEQEPIDPEGVNGTGVSVGKAHGTFCRTRSHVGTPSYLAREALLSRYTGEPYDAFKMDSWSLGVMLFFMLHGMHPFDYGSAEPMIVTKSLIERQLILDGEVELPPGHRHDDILAEQASHPSAPLIQRILRLELFWPPLADGERISEMAQKLIVELLNLVPEERRSVTSIVESEWVASEAEELKSAYDRIVQAP